MAKQSGKNGVVLIGGYDFSTESLQWDVSLSANASEVTGFGDGSHNFLHALKTGEMTVNMLWNSSDKTEVLLTTTEQSNLTILPAGYTLGGVSLSMPFYMANLDVSGSASGEAISAGSAKFVTRGTTGLELGQVLHHTTVTDSTTDIGIEDPNQVLTEITAECAGVIHVWDATATDTYVVKIQDSTDNVNWDDLITFTLDGRVLGSERVAVASGALEPYRRVIATRTGAAGDTFGFTVHFWHGGL